MQDTHGRRIHSMRISVTDRCNMRCSYCVSGGKLQLKPRDELLTLDEIETVIQAATMLGFDAFRFTGGEPLVRRGLVRLITRVSRLHGIRKLSLSTNGSLLAPNVAALADAGVRHLNISLDTLKPDRFKEVTRGGNLASVLEGIRTAIDAGTFNIKLNTVVMRGVNEDELCDLAGLTIDNNISVRFIEYMPFGNWQGCGGGTGATVSSEETLDRIRRHFPLEEDVEGPPGEGPARYLKVRGARGFVGVISPVYQPFCERCNRLRLTSDGWLKACLLRDERFSLRDWMRGPDFSFDELVCRVAQAVQTKPKEHEYSRNLDMSTVGG